MLLHASRNFIIYDQNEQIVRYTMTGSVSPLEGMVGESMPKSGVLTSPNYPSYYPNSHDSTQTIEVAEGKTIRFKWTDFETEPEYDYVQIVDENGVDITPKTWGRSLPPPSTSNSNIMHVKFHTDGDSQRTGWRLEWNEQ